MRLRLVGYRLHALRIAGRRLLSLLGSPFARKVMMIDIRTPLGSVGAYSNRPPACGQVESLLPTGAGRAFRRPARSESARLGDAFVATASCFVTASGSTVKRSARSARRFPSATSPILGVQGVRRQGAS